jgi:hypothetical protein
VTRVCVVRRAAGIVVRPRRARLVPAALLVLATALLPSNAHAYRTASDEPDFVDAGRVAWVRPMVLVDLSRAHPPGTRATDVEQALDAAMETWALAPVGRTVLQYHGLTDLPPAMLDERVGIGFVTSADEWRAMGFSPDMAATTDLSYALVDGIWQIVDADVHANAGAFTWTGDVPDRDLQAVFTHEIGHVLGLLHPCEVDGPGPSCDGADRGTVMDPVYHGLSQRILTDDDVQGVTFLYPLADACTATGCGGAQIGDPCTVGADCTGGLCDDSGRCATLCGGLACSGSCDWTLAVAQCGRGAGLGGSCTTGSDCSSGVCYLGRGGGLCTRPCGGGCPADFACVDVDSTEVCLPATHATSCSASSGRPGGAPVWLFLVLVVALRETRRKVS